MASVPNQGPGQPTSSKFAGSSEDNVGGLIVRLPLNTATKDATIQTSLIADTSGSPAPVSSGIQNSNKTSNPRRGGRPPRKPQASKRPGQTEATKVAQNDEGNHRARGTQEVTDETLQERSSYLETSTVPAATPADTIKVLNRASTTSPTVPDGIKSSAIVVHRPQSNAAAIGSSINGPVTGNLGQAIHPNFVANLEGDPNQFSRPPPKNRRIYNPRRNGGLPDASKDSAVSFREQCEYLKQIVDFHNPSMEITYDELVEREHLRLELQELVRDVVAHYASATDPSFHRESVSLLCFGSLRTGFATRGADMDLALVCPITILDPKSVETSIVPRLLEQVLLHKGYGARLLTRTRVPILRLCEKPTDELMEALLVERIKWDEAQKSAAAKLEPKVPEYSPSETETGKAGIPKSHADASNAKSAYSFMEDVGDGRASIPRSMIEAKKGTGPSEPPAGHRTDEELVRLFRLAMKEGWYSNEERTIIHRFVNCYYRTRGNVHDQDLISARSELDALSDVLSKYREPNENRLEFPKNGVGIHCDINFSNPLALHNTQLLRCYTICNPKIRDMVIFVKGWSKKRDINMPYRGTLSSYGYVLMVLHYAVNIARPPLAPNLQLQLSPVRGGSDKTPRMCNGHNVQFWRDEQQIITAGQRGQLNYSKESIGSLLRGFFHYYAEAGYASNAPEGGFMWSTSVLSLRTEGGILSKQSKGWTGARTDIKEPAGLNEKPVEIRQRYLLAIEDPFETDHNVARPVTHQGICAIRDEFRRAHRIIKNAGMIDGVSLDLFEETKRPELDRQPRYFGPNPALAGAKAGK